MKGPEAGHHERAGALGILLPELSALDARRDDRRDRRGEPAQSPLAHPVVEDAVLRAVDDLDEVAFVRLIADLADARAKGQQALDRRTVGVGRDRLDPVGHALRPSTRRPR